MSLKNDIKAGYQGQYDSMRAMAEKLMGTGGKKYKEGGLVMGESRQAMDNNMYAKDKKAAEKYQEREHKDYDMMKHREHEDYEKRKRYDENREKMNHERFEMDKKNKPSMNAMMEGPAFKKGGKVTSKCASKVQKFAAGGVAKIRHDVATTKGAPKNQSKGNLRSVYY